MTSSPSAPTPPTRPASRHYPGLDTALALARQQGGVITFRQAITAGLTRGQLRQLVRTDQWSHPVRGAFVVPVPGRLAPVPTAAETPLDDHRPADLHLVDLVAVAEASGPGPHSVVSVADLSVAGQLAIEGTAAAVRADVVGLPVQEGAAEPVGIPVRAVAPPEFAARVRAALVGRPLAVVCGETAARLLGFPALQAADPAAPVHLMMPARHTRAQPRGVRLHFTDHGVDEQTTVDGIAVTTAARTLADLVLASPGREAAVALMDAALRSGVVRDLRAARAAAQGRRGFRAALPWWTQADGRAQSPLETRLRLLLTEAGWAPRHLQWPVTDAAGQVVARLDLAWPAHRLDVEADVGAAAASAGAAHRERQRGNLLAAHGWSVLRFGDLDVDAYPDQVVAAVEQVLLGRGARLRRAS